MRSRIAALSLVLLAGACANGEVFPRTRTVDSATGLDPLSWQAKAHTGPGEFYLFGEDARELVRYERPRDIQLCASRNEDEIGRIPEREVNAVPLRVTWDGVNEAMLYPGNCLYFEAARVSVSPAQRLNEQTVLRGTIDPR